MKPGTPVVCVDDSELTINMDELPCVTEGQEYVVSWSGRHLFIYEGDVSCVRLKGIRRPQCPMTGEDNPPFAARRFVPLTMIEEKQREVLRA